MIDKLEAFQEIKFGSGGEFCGAWLFMPDGASESRPVPLVVMAHGLGGVKRVGLRPFAERFHAAGYACLVFDYRHFGDSSGEPREIVDFDKQLEDWRSAVGFARSLPGVDADAIAVWGTSLGGGHVIETAADDPRIAAAIAQCPFTDGRATGAKIDLIALAKIMPRVALDLIAERTGTTPVRVATAGSKGQAALMTTPDAKPGVEAMYTAIGEPYVSVNVGARILPRIMKRAPGRRAKDVSQPIFFAICEQDSVTPADATIAWAEKAPRAEIRRYETGHFDIYVSPWFDKVVADQVAFLQDHLPPASLSGNV